MKIKAIISDLDGTLINHDGIYDRDVFLLIKQIQEKNIQFSLATGRAYFAQVSDIIRELNLSPIHITNGGGMIINWKTGEVLLHRAISESSVKKIVKYFHKAGLAFTLETKEYAYMLSIIETAGYINKKIIRFYSIHTIPTGVLKILLHSSANKMSEIEVQNHKKNITRDCKDIEVIQFLSRNNYYGLDITSEGSTKHTAVLEYAKILGFASHEMVAIGDGYNDYPLFTACGYKIAMGNAPKELKEIADRVVSTVDNGGMKEALEHIISIL